MAKRDQTTGEEIANTVTHVIGSHLGAAMLALLVWTGVRSGTDVAWKATSGAVFGFCMILLYAVSSTYHAVQYPPAKRVLHVMDHMAIFFLIAGSYTPFCLVSLRPEHPGIAWTIFGIEWGMTLVGILFKIRTMWLFLGGGLYTLGCVFYLWKSLPYSHMVWHLFVLAGTICHFFCMLWHVMA